MGASVNFKRRFTPYYKCSGYDLSFLKVKYSLDGDILLQVVKFKEDYYTMLI